MASLDSGDAGSDAGTSFAGRTGHTAVWATGLSGSMLPKAAMIVWGGVTDLATGATAGDGQIYDPAGDKWIGPIPSGGGGPAARAYHSAVWGANGAMLVFGGASAAGSTITLTDNFLFQYTPGGSWNTLTSSPPPSARLKHTAVLDPGSMKMFVWGGFDGASMYFAYGSALDSTNTWTSLGGGGGPMPEGRIDHTAVVLAGSKGSQLVIFGGDNGGTIFDKGWSLDTGMGSAWTALPTPGPSARKNHTAVATAASATTPGSSMILWGGETAAGVYTNDGWIYTPQ
jgi:hypothetical protein